ncbi:MAG: MarR family winged helix-turn-helix transcriptional regulator [Candidatus Sulfotelmatobacter sp.]
MPTLSCLCASLRRASRVLTQHYDEALRPLGLRATQFTILQALSLVGEVSQGKLGEILAMDSTTLTRTLEIMCSHGWIVKRPGKDRRERRLRLSKYGEAQLNRALSSWQAVQKRLRNQLGNGRWDNLMNLVNEVTSAVTE